MTKEEAVKQLNNYIRNQEAVFCPLNGVYCNINCICYEPAYYDRNSVVTDSDQEINLDKEDIWFVRNGRCTAYILHGPEKGDE